MRRQTDWGKKGKHKTAKENWQAGQQIEYQNDWRIKQQTSHLSEYAYKQWPSQRIGCQSDWQAQQQTGHFAEDGYKQWSTQPLQQQPRMRTNTRAGIKSRRKMKKRSNKTLLRTILIILLIIGAIGKCCAGIFAPPNDKNYDEQINISSEVNKGEIPAFLQNDPRWGDKPYGNNTMAENGCGPTCLSMVYCSLTGKDTWNPYNLARKMDEEGYYVNGSGTAWLAMTELANEIGLKPYEVRFEESAITSELEKGTPIICSMKPGDFTTSGHFIVLTGIDSRGNVTVQDPNSKDNSRKTWLLKDLMPQISNLWGYEETSVFSF